VHYINIWDYICKTRAIMLFNMKILKLILISGTILISISRINAQYEYPGVVDSSVEQKQNKQNKSKATDEASRIFFGGNLGLSFGSYTYIQLAPTIGYKFTPRFWSGIGPEYMYISWREINYKSSIYGFRNFASFSIFKDINEVIHLNISNVFLYAENEVLNIQTFDTDTLGHYYPLDRNWYDILLGGVGVRMPIGDKAGISLIVMWGLNRNAQMLYSNPEIRFSLDI
jgi:hypothetical protein